MSIARVGTAAASIAVLLSADAASASQDPPRFTAGPSLPRLPAPFLLPELAHPRLELRADWLLGHLGATSSLRNDALVGIVRPSFEVSVLAPRRIFVGASWPIAWALPPDGGLAPGESGRPSGTRTLIGNVEAHARVVFPLPTFLESGLTVGIVAPTALYDRLERSGRSASEAASSLDPTSYASFLPNRVALRPAGDLRFIRGPFVIQARHGIDIVIDGAGIDRVKVAGRLLGHAGFLFSPNVEVSLEASQVYFFSSDEKVSDDGAPANAFAERYRISDVRRAAFVMGPALRLSYPDTDVGIAIVTNVGSPLSPAISGFVGLRVSVMGHAGSALVGSVRDSREP